MNEKQLAQKEQELTKLADKIRAKGYSLETERSYLPAVSKFIDFICDTKWRAGTSTEDYVGLVAISGSRKGAAR